MPVVEQSVREVARGIFNLPTISNDPHSIWSWSIEGVPVRVSE